MPKIIFIRTKETRRIQVKGLQMGVNQDGGKRIILTGMKPGNVDVDKVEILKKDGH
jgi:hypothetical protein